MRLNLFLCIYFSLFTSAAGAKPTLHPQLGSEAEASGGHPASIFLNVTVEKGPAALDSAVMVNSAVQDCLLGAWAKRGDLPLPLVLRGRLSPEGAWKRPWVRGGGWDLNRCLEKALTGVVVNRVAGDSQVIRVRLEKGMGGKGLFLKPKSVKKFE